MPTVIVTPPPVIQVRNGVATNPQVASINYGGQNNQLKTATDLSLVGAVDGGAITYHANTGIFTINAVASTITNIDNGFF